MTALNPAPLLGGVAAHSLTDPDKGLVNWFGLWLWADYQVLRPQTL
jgi:hypothetical protein